MDTPSEEFVTVENALLVADGAVLTIEVDGVRYTVAMYEVSMEQSIRRAGDRGAMLFRREFAERIGLVASGPRPVLSSPLFRGRGGMTGERVLVVENEPDGRDALRALL